MRKQMIEVIRVLLYLLPPSLVLLIASPMLLSPFVNEEGVDVFYWLVAVPLYLGIIAVPGYVYAVFADVRAKNMRPRPCTWVRMSLISALVASVWATAMIGPAWREILPFVLLPASSTVTSAFLLYRFEFGDGALPHRA